jgi:hypothetical protein
MKRAFRAVLVVMLLVSVMTLTCSIGLVRAQWAENPVGEIIIHSPERKTDTNNTVSLNLTITGQGYVLGHGGGLFSERLESQCFLEFLDASSGGRLVSKRLIALSDTGDGYAGNVTWPDLAEGAYNLTVYASVYRNMLSFESLVWRTSESVLFAVDATPTEVSVLSPLSEVYEASDVSLSFVVTDPVSSVVCKLDGEYLNVKGNVSLTGLSAGAHNLMVYVTDRVGDWVESESVNFSVLHNEEQEMFNPTLILIAVVALAAAVSFGLTAYFLKRKKRCSA